jgi:membrane protein YqaA with SNARE-associated domain
VPAATLAIIAAVAGSLVTWLVAVRRFSGKVETSEARDLWAESAAIREWSRRRIEDLEARVETLEGENSRLRARMVE